MYKINESFQQKCGSLKNTLPVAANMLSLIWSQIGGGPLSWDLLQLFLLCSVAFGPQSLSSCLVSQYSPTSQTILFTEAVYHMAMPFIFPSWIRQPWLKQCSEILLTSTNLSHLSCWFRKERKKKKITVGSPVTKFGNHPKKHFKRSYYFQSVNSTHMGWESFVDSMEPVNSMVNMSNSWQ